jgi:CRP-like cAMP-binding protein
MSVPTAPIGQALVVGNRLVRTLAAHTPHEAAWLTAGLEPVTLELGAVLAGVGEPFAHVYFPETAVISVISHMADGAAVEVGTVGSEGVAGLAVFLEAEASTNETVAQIPGKASRFAAAEFMDGLNECPELRRLLNRYTHAYLTQVAQTAACNGVHKIEARCARWLLMTHDRVDQATHFPLIQKYLAIMLGVQRGGVSAAAGALQDAGLIRYSRGEIQVLDRAGLEEAACECYGVVRRHFDLLLP